MKRYSKAEQEISTHLEQAVLKVISFLTLEYKCNICGKKKQRFFFMGEIQGHVFFF